MIARRPLADAEEAVSPIIATVLLLAIMISITGSMLAWGIPQLQRNEADAHYVTTFNNLLNLEADLEQVVTQGEGASRVTTFSFSAGTLTYREDIETWLVVYTVPTWADLVVRGFAPGVTEFVVRDLNETAVNLAVNLSYPDGTWADRAVVGDRLATIPPMVTGVHGEIRTLVNDTVVGGFYVDGVDALSYKHASMAGVYRLRLMNGCIMAEEPGGDPWLASSPLVRSSGNLDALHLYLIDYNLSESPFTSLSLGNWQVRLLNRESVDRGPFGVTGVRITVDGYSQKATHNSFISTWGFTRDENREEIYYRQATPFDLRLMERTVYVSFGLR